MSSKWKISEFDSNVFINNVGMILKKEILNLKTTKYSWKIYNHNSTPPLFVRYFTEEKAIPFEWANKKINEYINLEKIKAKNDNKARLYKLWREIVLLKYNNQCVINDYQCTEKLHVHHLISRKRKEFEFDLENGIVLCSFHHIKSRLNSAHNGSLGFVYWLQTNMPEKWEWYLNVKRIKHKTPNLNYNEIYENLLLELNKYSDGKGDISIISNRKKALWKIEQSNFKTILTKDGDFIKELPKSEASFLRVIMDRPGEVVTPQEIKYITKYKQSYIEVTLSKLLNTITDLPVYRIKSLGWMWNETQIAEGE
jgi:hypothetical protein